MSRYKIFLAFVCFFYGAPEVSAQDKVKPILEKIQKTFSSLDQLHMEMSTQYFYDPADMEPFRTDKAEIWMAGGQSKVKTENVEMLSTNSFLITVNHKMQLVQYQKKDSVVVQGATNLSKMFDLDSLMAMGPEIQWVDNKDDLIHLRLLSPDALMQQMDVFVHQQTYLVQRMEFVYNEEKLGNPLFVVISYPVFDMNPSINKDIFSEGQYIFMNKSRATLAKRLEGYSVQETKNTELN